jgi:hypothetical protein
VIASHEELLLRHSRIGRTVPRIRTNVPPNTAPPITSFWTKFPESAAGAAGCCIYVRDCLNAFRALESVLTGVVVRDVKKLAAGRLLWNDRIGVADRKAVFDAAPRVKVSRKGCRIVKAI